LNLATRRPGGVAELPTPGLFDAHHSELIDVPDPVTEEQLNEILASLPADVLRAKGVVNRSDGMRLLVQIVGQRRDVSPLPMAEDQPATPLVVIRPSRR